MTMVPLNPISNHLISRIIRYWLSMSDKFNHKGFFYFTETIPFGKYKIDRIGKGLIWFQDEIIPATWKDLRGPQLISIYSHLKDKKIYFYFESGGQYYKTKPK